MAIGEEGLAARRGERAALLERLRALLERDERVVAAWLGGSSGIGAADALSDLDLWVVVADARVEELLARRRDYVTAVGRPVLLQEVPQNGPPDGAFLLVLYEGAAGPQGIDWIWQPQATARRPDDVLLLFDRVGLPPAVAPARPAPEQRAQHTVQQVLFFWVLALNAAKRIARRRPWSALGMLRVRPLATRTAG